MLKLRDMVQLSEEDEDFINARDALANDFHVYDEEEGCIYEDTALDGFEWYSGITKVVIILDGFVMKKGFHGTVIDSDENGFLEPEDFIYNAWDTNYGTLEYQVYNKAVERGVGKFFAAMEALGDEVYAQEKCEEILDDILTSEDREARGFPYFSMEEIDEIISDLAAHDIWDVEEYMTSTVIPFFYFEYSYEDFAALVEFLQNYDITDIHAGNVGYFYDEEGRYVLKLFDYSGFASTTSEIIHDESIN